MKQIPVFMIPEDPFQKGIFTAALTAFGPFTERESKVVAVAKIHLARNYTLYGRITGEFDDASLERMNLFEELVEDELEFEIDAQKIFEKTGHTIPVENTPFTIETLRDAFLTDVISGRPWNEEADQEFMRPLREFEAGKLKVLASRTLLDIADPKIFSKEEIGRLDTIIDNSKPGQGFATYLLLQPVPIVRVECLLSDFLNACYKLKT
ncbi:MAG: hypothetical protein ABL958_02045 [Bdellovibrionia bacterium]